MAAAATGATTIIAVDIHNSRLEMTKELGATHTISSKDEDPAEKIKRLTGDGVQFALDTTGVVAVTRQAADSLAINGTVGLVGAPAPVQKPLSRLARHWSAVGSSRRSSRATPFLRISSLTWSICGARASSRSRSSCAPTRWSTSMMLSRIPRAARSLSPSLRSLKSKRFLLIDASLQLN